jgi:hypothetical protein
MERHPLLDDWIASREQLVGSLAAARLDVGLNILETEQASYDRHLTEREIGRLNRLIYKNTPSLGGSLTDMGRHRARQRHPAEMIFNTNVIRSPLACDALYQGHQIRVTRSECMWFAYVYPPQCIVALDTVARATPVEGRELAFERACRLVDGLSQ